MFYIYRTKQLLEITYRSIYPLSEVTAKLSNTGLCLIELLKLLSTRQQCVRRSNIEAAEPIATIVKRITQRDARADRSLQSHRPFQSYNNIQYIILALHLPSSLAVLLQSEDPLLAQGAFKFLFKNCPCYNFCSVVNT